MRRIAFIAMAVMTYGVILALLAGGLAPAGSTPLTAAIIGLRCPRCAVDGTVLATERSGSSCCSLHIGRKPPDRDCRPLKSTCGLPL